MPQGNPTTVTQLSDALNTMVAAARITRQHEGVMSQLVDVVTLQKGTGTNWIEWLGANLTAQSVAETTDLADNPQQINDSLVSFAPALIGLSTLITDRVQDRISSRVFATFGQLGQRAIALKEDQDGITLLDSGTSMGPGAGGTPTSGHVTAAVVQIQGNSTEPGPPPYRVVAHPYQLKYLWDELTAGIGTYAVPNGPTADVYKRGFMLPIAGAEVYADGNITIDSSADAKGGVFSQMGIVKVQGASPRTAKERKEGLGGGATMVYFYDEYVYGIRSSSMVKEFYSDATAPTS